MNDKEAIVNAFELYMDGLSNAYTERCMTRCHGATPHGAVHRRMTVDARSAVVPDAELPFSPETGYSGCDLQKSSTAGDA